MNHETSLVPFPATRQDHINSTISKLRLNQNSAGVLKGEYVIPQSAGYQRFCSNFLVGAEHGFERELLLTNEEARDIVLPADGSWEPGLTLATPNTEQAGVVVALDVRSGAAQVDLRHGTAQPRELGRHPELRVPGRALR